MIHLKNILCSFYCGANLKFIYHYIYCLFFNKKIYKKNLSIKDNFLIKIGKLKQQKILVGLEMQVINYNIPHLYEVLSNENLLDKKMNGLIVGCYEGYSTLFFITHCIHANFTCVDVWNKQRLSQGYNGDAEKYFDKNTETFQDRINKIKDTSQSFFNKNSQKFDFIYLDGAHDPKIVEADCRESLHFLSHNGILIINSIFWRGFKKIKKNNLYGISNFMKKNKNFKIIYVTRNTLFLKKK